MLGYLFQLGATIIAGKRGVGAGFLFELPEIYQGLVKVSCTFPLNRRLLFSKKLWSWSFHRLYLNSWAFQVLTHINEKISLDTSLIFVLNKYIHVLIFLWTETSLTHTNTLNQNCILHGFSLWHSFLRNLSYHNVNKAFLTSIFETRRHL